MASHYQNHVGVFGCEPKSRTSSLHKRMKEMMGNQMKAKWACKLSHLKAQTLLPAPGEAGLCSVPPEGFSQVTRWQQQSSDPLHFQHCVYDSRGACHWSPIQAVLNNAYNKHGCGAHQAGLTPSLDTPLVTKSWPRVHLTELQVPSFLNQ